MENGSMAVRLHASSVSISIDSESDSHGSHRGETVASVLTELLDRLNHHEIAATWAFHDPAQTLLAERIVAHPLGHEIAILGDAAPAQSQFSRAYLLNGLGRRLQTATAAGFSISTLAVFDDWQPRNTDLLVKLGFSMVRGQRPLRRESQGALRSRRGIQSISYGLSFAPAAAMIVGGKWLANRLQLRQLRRMVDRALERGDHCHLCIDAAALAEGDISDTLRMVDRWLRRLAELRDAEQLTIATLCNAGQKIRPKRQVAAHSILRAA
jgi:hypothetical protein